MGTSPQYLEIEFLNSEEVIKEPLKKQLPFAASPLYYAPILESKLLTEGGDVHQIYEVVLDIKDINFDIEPGDTIGIYPSNDPKEIKEIIRKLELEDKADKLYKLSVNKNTSKKNAKIPSQIPERGTIMKTLMHQIDVRYPPKKLFLQTLAEHTSADDEKSELLFLSSKEGSEKYKEFISTNMGLIDILNKFPSCKPPIVVLLQHLHSLQARPYSVSRFENRNTLSIVFSIINFKNGRKGICTGWLEKLINKQVEDVEGKMNNLTLNSTKKKIPFYFRQSRVQFPKDPSVPIIMIGPGTGVSPFIGFLQHRLSLVISDEMEFNKCWLFYGCRYSKRDFLFKTELQKFVDYKILEKLFVGFSREGEQKYVQELIFENGVEFVEMIVKQGAFVYICGDVKNMMQDTRRFITNCFMEFGKMERDSAMAFVEKLERERRYVEDSWI